MRRNGMVAVAPPSGGRSWCWGTRDAMDRTDSRIGTAHSQGGQAGATRPHDLARKPQRTRRRRLAGAAMIALGTGAGAVRGRSWHRDRGERGRRRRDAWPSRRRSPADQPSVHVHGRCRHGNLQRLGWRRGIRRGGPTWRWQVRAWRSAPRARGRSLRGNRCLRCDRRRGTPAQAGKAPRPCRSKAPRDPLRETVVQRGRDLRDGRACFPDNPIPAPPLPGGRQVQSGPSTTRSVRCMHPARIVRTAQLPTPEPPRATPSAGGPR